MKKIITFLGVYPKQTEYLFHDQAYSGEVFAEALRQFVTDYDEMLVLVTEKARSDVWPVLEKLQDPRIHAIDIPDGENNQQVWQIFETVIDLIDEGDHVVFDITHGLRSLPFLTFLFAAYLKVAKSVTIEAVYYGALELKNKPVLDLSEFVQMLDWLVATDDFVETGNARRLAQLIDPGSTRDKTAKLASEALAQVSQAALLCQPFELMNSISALKSRLQDAEKEIAGVAQPFRVLNKKIYTAFEQFEGDSTVPLSILRSEFNMIEWYTKNGQTIQMITLAREWLIDAVTYRLGLPFDFSYSQRCAIMERAISGIAKVGLEVLNENGEGKHICKVSELNEYGRRMYDTWPEHERDLLITIWNNLSAPRNALDHAQHQNTNARMNMKTIVKKAKMIPPLLQQLAKAWGILP